MAQAKSSNSPAMAFIMDYLQEHGDTVYAEVKAAAEADGHSIYPIMYGRAKTLLGMITEENRSRRRRRKAPKDDGKPARLRQGASGADSTANELSSFLERFRELEEERNRYRAALLSVEKLLRDALASASS
ncbi:MAG: hypothetical protein CMJ83_18630 [Planctomycetes bacterium]|nr:hypothetical protein [Planctomycetota bacterium]